MDMPYFVAPLSCLPSQDTLSISTLDEPMHPCLGKVVDERIWTIRYSSSQNETKSSNLLSSIPIQHDSIDNMLVVVLGPLLTKASSRRKEETRSGDYGNKLTSPVSYTCVDRCLGYPEWCANRFCPQENPV